jgi:hypothetical protein
LPADVLAITTLPPAVGSDMTKLATIQPMAGAIAPPSDLVPQLAKRQDASTSNAKHTAATGAGPRLYWNVPINPSNRPSTNSRPYVAVV